MARPVRPPRYSIVIATYGAQDWEDLAHERAKPSAERQGADAIVCVHLAEGTLADARNLGAKDAGGDWLVFLDADDELEDGYLDALRAGERELAHSETNRRLEDALLAPSVAHVSPAGIRSTPELPNRHRDMTWLNHCVIGTAVPAPLFRQVGGFRDDIPVYEDWELWLRCIREGAKLLDVPAAVYRAYDRPFSRNHAGESILTYDLIRAEHEAAS